MHVCPSRFTRIEDADDRIESDRIEEKKISGDWFEKERNGS